MNGNRWNGWLVAAVSFVLVAIAATVAYNVGLSQGLAQVGAAAGTPPANVYGWRHGGWGFGPLFPLLFIFFWLFVFKTIWWRPWGHWGPWSYYGPPPHFRDRFDEWHRQAHERMGGEGKSRES